jgi:hypothetical protein
MNYDAWTQRAFETQRRLTVTRHHADEIRALTGLEPEHFREDDPEFDSTALHVFRFEDREGEPVITWLEQLREPGLYSLRLHDTSADTDRPYCVEPGSLQAVFEELAARMWMMHVDLCDCGETPAVCGCKAWEPRPESALRTVLSGAALLGAGIVLNHLTP